MKKLRKENSELVQLIRDLDKGPQPIWKRTAELLARSRRNRVEVNLSKLEQYSAGTSPILVPGKLLGTGDLSKKLIVAAFSFSEGAKKAIETAGGKAISIQQLKQDNLEGKGVILLV